MKECFIPKAFQQASLELIGWANEILDAYKDQGFKLSLRQLYYQLVAKDLISNTSRSYKRLGNIIGAARLAGLIDWSMIEDRERPTVYPSHWESPAQIARTAIYSFRLDRWRDQPNHVEVMVEKKALEGVLIPVCRELDVRFTANRGYSSLTALYWAGARMERAIDEGKLVTVLYLGDHDPSGLDMDRDIAERLALFSGCEVELDRLALLYSQVEEMRLPENPAKLTATRAPVYIAQYGRSSWELDAVEPSELASMVRRAVTALRDEELWRATIAREEEMREDLRRFAEQYDS